MEPARQIQRQFLRSRRLPLLAISLTLFVLAAAILASCLYLRERVRDQIAARAGETLAALARVQLDSEEGGLEGSSHLEDPAEEFDLILRISRLKGEGVLGIRLFGPDGTFTNAFPASITESTLSPEDLAGLRTLNPVTHFYPAARLAALDLIAQLDKTDKRAPLLEVNVPLRATARGGLAGVAQFIVEGETIAREYAMLDRHLLLQGGITFLGGGTILTLALALAFRHIQRVNALLSDRTERLLQANQELVLAAKTAAVGAVTSHLIHGLKNPLSGLQGFVKSHLPGQTTELVPEDWQDALATTQRMQALIAGVVRVLEEQKTTGHYEISLRELVEIISSKMLPMARGAGVQFYTQLKAEGLLANREANLVILILENLVQNALQATPEGKSVRLLVTRAEGEIHCEVRDEGPGFAQELRARLFAPCHSTKEGGSGIGLAISKQLATQINASLELKATSPAGCVFRLSFPQTLVVSGHLVPDTLVSD